MAELIRLLIVDDDPLVRFGLSLVLGADRDIEVVGEASDGQEAIDAVPALRPDVVLMDVRMPGTDGITATAALRSRPDAPAVIVLTTFDTDEYVMRALQVGANGFLLKDTPPATLIDAVRRAAVGESMVSPTVLGKLIDRVVDRNGAQEREARMRRAEETLAVLTERERDVAGAVGQGLSNAEISAQLFMSVATVKAYVSRILTKLGCSNRVQIAILVHDLRG